MVSVNSPRTCSGAHGDLESQLDTGKGALTMWDVGHAQRYLNLLEEQAPHRRDSAAHAFSSCVSWRPGP